jgi:hypothetical protein
MNMNYLWNDTDNGQSSYSQYILKLFISWSLDQLFCYYTNTNFRRVLNAVLCLLGDLPRSKLRRPEITRKTQYGITHLVPVHYTAQGSSPLGFRTFLDAGIYKATNRMY